MDGAQILKHSSLKSQTHFLGIPLTVDILIEIICFGCANPETDVCDEICLLLNFVINGTTLSTTNRYEKTQIQWCR